MRPEDYSLGLVDGFAIVYADKAAMIVRVIGNLHVLALRERFFLLSIKAATLNVGVNIFTLFVTHSLIPFRSNTQNAIAESNERGVIDNQTAGMASDAVDLPAVRACLVKVTIYLNFHN